MLNNLENAPGANYKKRKRVGRGIGSTLGKTCGRGHKGQNSRAGSGARIGYEGGQMPLHRRLPKRGFNNIFRKECSIVNLDRIVANEKIDKTKPITKEVLIAAGLIRKIQIPVKVLGDGTVDIPLEIVVERFSSTAVKKIEDAGGKATILNEEAE